MLDLVDLTADKLQQGKDRLEEKREALAKYETFLIPLIAQGQT